MDVAVEVVRTVVVPTQRALGAEDEEFMVRATCVGGRWLFVLGSFSRREGGLGCAVLAVDRERGEIEGVYQTGYIKYDNGGGTLRCLPDGSRLTLGREFTVMVVDFGGGEFVERTWLDTEQSTEEGWWFGPDHVLHLDEMERRGLVLTHVETGATVVATAAQGRVPEVVQRYAVSPCAPVAAVLGQPRSSRGRSDASVLVLLRLPELTPWLEVPLKNRRHTDELVVHPTRPIVLTTDDDRILEVRLGGPGEPELVRRTAGPLGRLQGFDATGRRLWLDPGYYALPSQPSTIGVWDPERDALDALILPHRVDAYESIDDQTMIAVHSQGDAGGGLTLMWLRVPSLG
ncbi:MAG: hypothetical protein KDK70_25600 [Myxococcales bacterium]|nr:hypothetical protein [Myxococcales bacterium]